MSEVIKPSGDVRPESWPKDDTETRMREANRALVARAEKAEAELARTEPHRRVIEGCKHSLVRMREWSDDGACPVCLTAEAGMLRTERNAARKERDEAKALLVEEHRACDEGARINGESLSESEADLEKALSEMAQARKERDEARELRNMLTVTLNDQTARADALEKALRDVWPMVLRAWKDDAPFIGGRDLDLTDSLRVAREGKIMMDMRADPIIRAALAGEQDDTELVAARKDAARKEAEEEKAEAERDQAQKRLEKALRNAAAWDLIRISNIHRCSLCGGGRVMQSDGTPGACSLLGCKDPLHDFDRELAARAELAGESGEPAPIPMVLHCPTCGVQHVDTPEPDKGWTNPPHKSHLCHGCGTIWRPADVPTNGVASVSRGKADTWPVGADEKPLPSQTPNEKPGPEFSPVADEAEALKPHSAECGAQPAGCGCICGVGFRYPVQVEAVADEAQRLYERLAETGGDEEVKILRAALAAAEKRGMERAAKICDAEWRGQRLASQIRALAAEQPEKLK